MSVFIYLRFTVGV